MTVRKLINLIISEAEQKTNFKNKIKIHLPPSPELSGRAKVMKCWKHIIVRFFRSSSSSCAFFLAANSSGET